MSKMSREKGKRGEREFAQWLNERFGWIAKRAGWRQVVDKVADVICEALQDLHIEVKRQERPNLSAAWLQAYNDAGLREPVVVTRKNGGEWFAYVTAQFLFSLLQKISRLEAELKEAKRKDD